MQSCLEKTVSVESLAGLAWHATGMMTLMTFRASCEAQMASRNYIMSLSHAKVVGISLNMDKP